MSSAASASSVSQWPIVLAALFPFAAIVISADARAPVFAAVNHPAIASAADGIIAASQPASTSWNVVHVAVLIYAMISYLLHSSLKLSPNSQPVPLSFALKLAHALHYVGLSLASLWMFFFMIAITTSRISNSSASSSNPFVPNSASSWLLCENGPTMSKDFYRLSFMYYLSKYWELLDSLFQIQKARSLGSKGSPPTFLHFYHHAAVIVMCLNWIESNQTLQWLGLAFNTFVHVIMYSYYAFTVYRPAPRPLKKLITQIQIVQFGSSLVIFMGTLYHIVVLRQSCVGMSSLAYNVIFNVSLLFLFSQFSERAYAAPPKAPISPPTAGSSAEPGRSTALRATR